MNSKLRLLGMKLGLLIREVDHEGKLEVKNHVTQYLHMRSTIRYTVKKRNYYGTNLITKILNYFMARTGRGRSGQVGWGEEAGRGPANAAHPTPPPIPPQDQGIRDKLRR